MIGRFAKAGSYRDLFDVRDVARVLLGGALALAGYLLEKSGTGPAAAATALILASVAVNGIPIVWGAVGGLLERRVNVDELVSLAIIASLIAGEFLSAAVVSFVMVLGALLEEATGESARRAIRSLIQISPTEAVVIEDGAEHRRPIADVAPGDLLLVKPGERIPVDALVVQGLAAVDESSITGESIPVEKSVGDEVFSGTLNQNGVLKIRAVKVGQDTTLGKVIQLVSEAESHHPVSTALIDRYARWFTPAILLCAAAAWAVTGELTRAVTVLIVGCPCALILAAPTATVAAISRAARSGILVKGGAHLETAASVDTVLFDKTGTLTAGDPRVDGIHAAEGIAEEHVLRQAACVEQNSTHPLARAVLKAAHYAKVTVAAAEDLITEIGLGVKGCVEGCSIQVGSAYLGGGSAAIPAALQEPYRAIQQRGATPLVVYQDDRSIGILSVSDPLRPGAAETLRQLRRLGVGSIGILSGDHSAAVEQVARSSGADRWWAGLKPEEKLSTVRRLREDRSGTILFVGDGINDAPALAAADIGVAMGAKGTEVALETADIALMHDDISRLPFLISLGRRMVRIIQWNIFFGLAFNLVAVVAGGGGWLSPIMGALVHNVGSVIVVLSSASLAFWRNQRDGLG